MKKGGSTTKAKKMADGGGALNAMMGTPALVGRPAVNAPVRAPGKPSMANRRKAMMAKATTPSGPSMPMPAMKKGGKAEGGESKAAHKAEMAEMGKIEKELKSHEGKPASKAHKGLKTGGVIDGQGGYAKGGIINTEKQGGEYRNTKMHTSSPDRSPAKTGGVKDGNGGGYATGGVAKANAGGYKKGGSSKKAYATGGKVNSGAPVAMPQGSKPVPAPVSIGRLAGTYKAGGRATPAEAVLLKKNKAENATAMREAKTDSNLKYGSPKRMKAGGSSSEKEMDMSKGAYDAHYANEKADNEAMRDMVLNAPRKLYEGVKGLFSPKTPQGSVTKTEKSVTVSPAGKKRGGRAC
jgi:hypothetical protein